MTLGPQTPPGRPAAAPSRPDPVRTKWNERYARDSFTPFPPRPAQWLVEHRSLVERLPAVGRALDLACGDGRNARYLAELGFEVDAVDISDVVVGRLAETAATLGLNVSARVADLQSGVGIPAHAYAVIVNFNYLQRDLFDEISRALRPGGLLLFETFARPHVDQLGRDFPAEFVLGDNELLRAFPALQVCHYFEGVAERSGEARGLAGLVARRRGSSPGREYGRPGEAAHAGVGPADGRVPPILDPTGPGEPPARSHRGQGRPLADQAKRADMPRRVE